MPNDYLYAELKKIGLPCLHDTIINPYMTNARIQLHNKNGSTHEMGITDTQLVRIFNILKEG